jgi:tetratricopeptide (TPR) repeat protein
VLGNYKDAIATLQQAQKVAPKDAQVFDELGWAYALSGDSARAISQLKRAIEAEPSYVVPYGHIGYVYFVQQDWEDAVSNLQKAIDLGGTILEYYYELGISYVNLKNCGKGREWIDKAVQINSEDQAVQGAVSWYQQHCEGAPAPTPKKK